MIMAMIPKSNGELHGKMKPTVLKPDWGGIPDDLKIMKIWLVWKFEYKAGSTKPWAKVPYAQKGQNIKRASSTDPTTWRTFETAQFLYESADYDGVGIVLQNDIVGIDLDNCRDPITGELSPTAKQIISTLNSYSEVSPSGTGVKILCRAPIPGPRNKDQAKGIEMYHRESPRYFTITGHHLEGTPTTIQERKAAVEDVYRVYLRPLEEKTASKTAPLPPATGSLTVEEILAVATAASNAEKFSRLWAGDWAGDFPSQSEADMALCSILSFYAGHNAELVDRAFRQSGLMRDKWEREDYRERTLGMAHSEESFDWAAYRRGQENAGLQISEEKLEKAMSRAVVPDSNAVEMAADKFSEIDAAVKQSVKKPIKKEKLTQPQTLIKLAEEGAELWKTPDQVAYATVKVEGHRENWPIKLTQFRRWLVGRYYDVLGETAGEKAIKSALEILDHKAMAGPTNEIHLRLARMGNTIFWDLGNDAWECVEITAAGWRVISNPPVKFRRTGQTAPLPYPIAGGKGDAICALGGGHSTYLRPHTCVHFDEQSQRRGRRGRKPCAHRYSLLPLKKEREGSNKEREEGKEDTE